VDFLAVRVLRGVGDNGEYLLINAVLH